MLGLSATLLNLSRMYSLLTKVPILRGYDELRTLCNTRASRADPPGDSNKFVTPYFIDSGDSTVALDIVESGVVE